MKTAEPVSFHMLMHDHEESRDEKPAPSGEEADGTLSQATLSRPPRGYRIGPRFAVRTVLIPECHRFNEVLETFLRGSGPY